MIKNKNNLTTSFILIFFLFSAAPVHCWDPRPTTINIGLGIALLNVATLFRTTPSLYTKPQGNYIQIVEERVNSLKFVLESPTEEQLIVFKYELIGHYTEILNRRGILSKIFENAIPNQPYALLNEEIKQHLNQLEFWEGLLSYTAESDEMKNGLERIKNLKHTLASIQRHFQSYTCFQIECALARQDDFIYKAFHLVIAILAFCLVDQEIDSMIKQPLLYNR